MRQNRRPGFATTRRLAGCASREGNNPFLAPGNASRLKFRLQGPKGPTATILGTLYDGPTIFWNDAPAGKIGGARIRSSVLWCIG
jgi:hypothetical protein